MAFSVIMSASRVWQPFFINSSQFSPSKFSHQPTRRLRRMSISANNRVVEHVVLFYVKQGTDDSVVGDMLKSLNSLSTLEGVLQLSAAPVHRISSPIPFSYILHSRYPSKEALSGYANHPAHVEAVKKHVLPNCAELMAVDWVYSNPSSMLLSAGSTVRITLMKLKEGADSAAKERILEKLKGDGAPCSFGENFSPARAKGFSLASLVEIYQQSDEESEKSVEESATDHIESTVVVEYVVPMATSNL